MADPIALRTASLTSGLANTDELSDVDLEQVVGGLARIWHVDAPATADPLPASLSISSIVTVEAPHRIPA
jgi:hypothetical protein